MPILSRITQNRKFQFQIKLFDHASLSFSCPILLGTCAEIMASEVTIGFIQTTIIQILNIIDLVQPVTGSIIIKHSLQIAIHKMFQFLFLESPQY